MSITEANKIHPLKLFFKTHLVEDDHLIRELVGEILPMHGLPKHEEWGDPDEYTSYLDTHPDDLPHICIFDYYFKDPITGMHKMLNGMDLTRLIMKRAEDLEEAEKPKVIMISGFDSPKVSKEFTNSDGFRWIDKNWDLEVFKKDLMDALNVAVIRTKRYYEKLAKRIEREKFIESLLIEYDTDKALPIEEEIVPKMKTQNDLRPNG